MLKPAFANKLKFSLDGDRRYVSESSSLVKVSHSTCHNPHLFAAPAYDEHLKLEFLRFT